MKRDRRVKPVCIEIGNKRHKSKFVQEIPFVQNILLFSLIYVRINIECMINIRVRIHKDLLSRFRQKLINANPRIFIMSSIGPQIHFRNWRIART